MSGIFEQVAVLKEGVMRASQLSDKQQDAKKDDKAAGIDWNMDSIINSELIEHTLTPAALPQGSEILRRPSCFYRTCCTKTLNFVTSRPNAVKMFNQNITS